MSLLLYAVLGVVAAAAFIALAYARRWDWTGFTETRHSGGGDAEVQRGKTLWDWLQLLIIPLALAAVVFALNDVQSGREQQREDQRVKRESVRAAAAAERERKRADDAVRERALRDYVSQMSDLLLERNLRTSRHGSEVRDVARTLTLTALRRLDGDRKGLALQMLEDARLISGISPTVRLDGADLRGASLADGNLVRPNFSRADLRGAVFRGADLETPHFVGARLSEADFRHVSFYEPEFYGANAVRADFGDANFARGTIDSSDLRKADFSGAYLEGVTFRQTCLTNARFTGAELAGPTFEATLGRDVSFAHADLRTAHLKGLFLRHPGLDGAKLPRGWRPTRSGVAWGGSPASTGCRPTP